MTTRHQDTKSYHSVKVIIPASFNDMPRILRLALAESGWKRTGGDDAIGSMTAALNRSMRERSMTFTDDLQLILNWEQIEKRVQLSLSIADLVKTQNESDCKRRSDLFLQVLRQKAEQLKKAPVDNLDPSIHPLAKFADLKRLKEKGLLEQPNDPEKSKRFRIGRFENRIVSLPPNQSEMHQLVCGPTRCGKTTGLFVPNLIERIQTSAIVTEATAGDEAPDLYSKTAGYRAQNGHKIYYFNPDDLHSNRVNPLDQIELDRYAGRHVSTVAKLIMNTTTQDKHTGDQFWTDSERFLLKSLIWHAVGERKHGNGHLGYICELLQLTEDDLKAIMASSRIIKAREQFGSFISKGSEDTRNIVMGGLLQRLDLWTEPMTVELTRATNINIDELPDQLFTFYISMPGHKEELQPLASLLFNWIMQIVLDKKFKYPITLLLDEFTNFGFINRMDNKLTTIGHRKIPICMGIQDTVQLKTVYDKFADIFRTQPGTRIFFRPRDGDVAKRISEDLGITTVIDYEPSASEIIPKKLQKQLLSREQLLTLEDKCIVFLPIGGAALVDFHTWQEYEWATKIPPPQREKIAVPAPKLWAEDSDEEETPQEMEDLSNAAEDLNQQMSELAKFIKDKLAEASHLQELGRSEDASLIYQQALEAESLMRQVQEKLENLNQTSSKQNFVPAKEEPAEKPVHKPVDKPKRKRRADPWLKDEPQDDNPQPKKTR